MKKKIEEGAKNAEKVTEVGAKIKKIREKNG